MKIVDLNVLLMIPTLRTMAEAVIKKMVRTTKMMTKIIFLSPKTSMSPKHGDHTRLTPPAK